MTGEVGAISHPCQSCKSWNSQRSDCVLLDRSRSIRGAPFISHYADGSIVGTLIQITPFLSFSFRVLKVLNRVLMAQLQ